MKKTATIVYTYDDTLKDWVKMLEGKYEAEAQGGRIALGTFGTPV